MIYVTSFGYRTECRRRDLVFDVRFLLIPITFPRFKNLSAGTQRGPLHPVFPQTVEFVQPIRNLLIYLLPHYIQRERVI